MSNRILIDASHPEETRVAVLSGKQVEEFDFESETKRRLRGNIYLGQITRVEPSLQAAFVEYGGNRQGFLAFSEIHPDYYQIPKADREALIREHAAADREKADLEDRAATREADKQTASETTTSETDAKDSESAAPAYESPAAIEDIGGDAHEEASTSSWRRAFINKYKIQEVIKRRQVILVQVVKEERGNKGAALTTFLSLAGRYCVLMPNTARGGGISRKISNGTERRQLKKIISELNLDDGMGMIIRTAGAQRTATEIKKDYQYLIRMWEKIRDLTLNSEAPALVHEESNLIKRVIRDMYNKDFESILVQGEEGYKAVKSYMKMLIPSHARKVKLYKGAAPLYQENDIEEQLASMFNPTVPLPSGGYLVINQTEALVAIDVNSGKATKEHSIEKTAQKTNLEAVQEAARQMRLRDLAGLLVLDLIDMSEHRHNRAVERKLKEALKHDRARIRVGRISPFGLLEMSRQRMRTSVLEGSSVRCEHCNGTGMMRSVESRVLHILRILEEEADKIGKQETETRPQIIVNVPTDAANYILNHKRSNLATIEERTNIKIIVNRDSTLTTMQITIEQVDKNGKAKLLRLDGDPESLITPKPENKGKRTRGRRGGRRRKSDHAKHKNDNRARAEHRADSDTQGAQDAKPDTDTQDTEAVSTSETESPDKAKQTRAKKRTPRPAKKQDTKAAQKQDAKPAKPAKATGKNKAKPANPRPKNKAADKAENIEKKPSDSAKTNTSASAKTDTSGSAKADTSEADTAAREVKSGWWNR